jgi:hypothetical protein
VPYQLIHSGERSYRVYLEPGSHPPRGRVAALGLYHGKVCERDLTANSQLRHNILAKAVRQREAHSER